MKLLSSLLVFILFMFGIDAIAQDPHAESGLKKVIVQEVLQVSSYTYLNVLEDGNKKWIAVPTIEAKLGETYYYKGGMEMPNFYSNELDRTFDSVLFLGSITSAEAIDVDTGMVDPDAPKEDVKPAKQPTLDRLALNIEAIEGGVRIGTLFEKASQYAGQRVKVVGEVTKFTANIMGKNWIHVQDGTDFKGAYDLMVTSQEIVSVGDIVVFEGVIAVDKNFGAGYFYKVIMEEAVLLK
ncbi:hypothetical protein [Aestuariivivens sediminis]|uniref:hypothetical protein n=1 Tax=Aestuariivivens sediminis TaxID=2913557 RepID=UPI001F584023|nr:hypothetical protein [Aestuariivivens sediminis]